MPTPLFYIIKYNKIYINMAIKNRKPKKIYPVNVASLLQWDYIIGIPKCLKKLGWMILAKSRGND